MSFAGVGSAHVIVSYFDLDGTLLQAGWTQSTWFYVLNQGSPLRALRQAGRALLRVPALAWVESRDRERYLELWAEAYQGISEDRLDVLSEELEEKSQVSANVYPLSLVAEAKSLGHQIVWISEGLECELRPLARKWGVDRLIANRLEIADHRATGRLIEPRVTSKSKANRVREDALAHGVRLEQSFAYASQAGSAALLELVGNPRVVEPEEGLRELSRTRNWQVVASR